jgi:hypothetical protein
MRVTTALSKTGVGTARSSVAMLAATLATTGIHLSHRNVSATFGDYANNPMGTLPLRTPRTGNPAPHMSPARTTHMVRATVQATVQAIPHLTIIPTCLPQAAMVTAPGTNLILLTHRILPLTFSLRLILATHTARHLMAHPMAMVRRTILLMDMVRPTAPLTDTVLPPMDTARLTTLLTVTAPPMAVMATPIPVS